MAEAVTRYSRVPWYNSLKVRVIALCAVLVLCLLGSVYILTAHYFVEVVREMENQTLEMANDVQIWFDAHPDEEVDLERIKEGISRQHQDVVVDLSKPDTNVEQVSKVESRFAEDGCVITRYHIARAGMDPIQLTAQFRIHPQTAILHAFKNRYLMALTGVFLITLGLMIYFIVKSLRPLSDLAESCARISEGKLSEVEVRKSYGEILGLEQTFNHMVRSLREKEIVEANLRQAQRLSALGTLAAGIAHDVRNPLNAIKLLSSHALDTLEDAPNPSAAANQLRTIRKEVDRLDEIVSGFLALAKERQLQPEPVSIDPLLAGCLHLVQQDAEARGIRLSSDLRAGDTKLLLDPKQCTRAVLNVLINALEATPAGGRVRLFSRIIEDACQIEVRDDGPGLTKDVAERAFDPYFTTKPTGTGIGLSITRGIIEEHGGTIELSCTVGAGCHVLITFPLRHEGVV
ncbi:MAG: HAMP domain-containing protein [Candidatus Hydrogenedentes bacterium]|nr:HAMP domain-containing protein [Candidatus Hydrogenedentota bacterium]